MVYLQGHYSHQRTYKCLIVRIRILVGHQLLKVVKLNLTDLKKSQNLQLEHKNCLLESRTPLLMSLIINSAVAQIKSLPLELGVNNETRLKQLQQCTYNELRKIRVKIYNKINRNKFRQLHNKYKEDKELKSLMNMHRYNQVIENRYKLLKIQVMIIAIKESIEPTNQVIQLTKRIMKHLVVVIS